MSQELLISVAKDDIKAVDPLVEQLLNSKNNFNTLNAILNQAILNRSQTVFKYLIEILPMSIIANQLMIHEYSMVTLLYKVDLDLHFNKDALLKYSIENSNESIIMFILSVDEWMYGNKWPRYYIDKYRKNKNHHGVVHDYKI